MSCFSVEHPHDFPFSHFIRYLWDLTNICGDSIGNYVSAVRTRLSLHSMSPIPECRYASALLTTLRAQPRDRAFRDPAPAALIAAAMADESTDLAVRVVIAILWYAITASQVSHDPLTSHLPHNKSQPEPEQA